VSFEKWLVVLIFVTGCENSRPASILTTNGADGGRTRVDPESMDGAIADSASSALCDSCEEPPHAIATCIDQICGFTCNPGFDDCDGLESTGCEANLDTSVPHCGSCDNACGTVGLNVTAVCDVGSCATVCRSGFEDCNGNPADGCEVGVLTSEIHCGVCGSPCVLPPAALHATPICLAGGCRLQCETNYYDCNSTLADGCERVGSCS
jgi:hypothetical protein